MTRKAEHAAPDPSKPRPSFLPFDPADLVAMRVRPAEFARMLDVSKQTVSQWIRRGIVTLGPDGLLNPKVAMREYLERTDPARQRARVLKQAGASLDELRARVRKLESELTAECEYGVQREEAATFRANDTADQRLTRLIDALDRRWCEAVEARCDGRWEYWSQELIAVEFYGHTPDEYRSMWIEDGGDEAATVAKARP